MDFILWVSRVMHVVSAVVWLGGLIFLNAVLNPVLRHQGMTQTEAAVATIRRFIPFLRFSIWTILTTGIFLTILSPRHLQLDGMTLWSVLLVTKVVLFLVLLFFSWQIGKVAARLEEIKNGGDGGWWSSLERLIERSVLTGLAVLLCAAGMAVA